MTRACAWRGYRVKEADTNISILALESDGGVRGDPLDCRVAHSLTRAFPGRAHAVYTTVTLIELEPGVMTRFWNGPEVAAAIRAFDKTGEMPAGMYSFGPPPPYRRLDARSAENKRRGEKRIARPPRTPRDTGIANGKPPRQSQGRRDALNPMTTGIRV